MRSRNIKPGFLENEDLATADPLISLLFAGLWMMADREGRLEDRPLRFKAKLFPLREDYTVAQITEHVRYLGAKRFVCSYEVAGRKLLCINEWKKHQNPHHQEKPSTLPAPHSELEHASVEGANRFGGITEPLRENNGGNRAGFLIPDSLIPDSPTSRDPPNSFAAKAETDGPTEAGWLAREFWILRKGPAGRDERDRAVEVFEELLRLGRSKESVLDEIKRTDRVRTEPIWDLEKRLTKPQSQSRKTEAQIDARRAAVDAETERLRLEHEERLKNRGAAS